MRGRREEGGGGVRDEGKGRNEGVGWMREGKEEGIGARVHVLTHLAPVKLESFCTVASVPVQLEELTPCIHTVRTYSIYTHTQIHRYVRINTHRDAHKNIHSNDFPSNFLRIGTAHGCFCVTVESNGGRPKCCIIHSSHTAHRFRVTKR